MRTRTETRTRTTSVTLDGKTHEIPEAYEVTVPVAPVDWDAVALRGVLGVTTVAVTGAVVWSTVAIGSLLSRVAPEWISYMVAGIFDMAWISCLVLEWLSRYDQSRARLPRIAGWFALIVSMTLITIDGNMAGSLVVGVCGALVSAMSKGLWTVVMKHFAVTLDAPRAAWLDKERQETNAALAMSSAQRQLARSRARTADIVHALSRTQDTPRTEVVQDRTPVLSAGTDTRTDTRTDTDSGTDPAVRDRTAVRDLRTDELGQVRTGSISGFVRALVSEGKPDSEIRSAVLSEFGPDTKADSIRKSIERARKRTA